MKKAFNSMSISVKEMFAFEGVFTPRSTAYMGILLALTVVLNMFTIYITDTFQAINFSYLPGVIASMMYGPWAAIAFGFASDTLKFFTNSRGGYFFGYAISAMTANLIYALLLYKRPLKVWRVAVARALVMLIVTLGLDYIWQTMMSGQGAASFFATARMINRIVQFPFHVALIVAVGKIVDSVGLRKYK